MRLLSGLQSILPNVLVVVQRFPVPVFFAAIITFWLIRGVYLKVDVDYAAFALLSMFFASLAGALVGENKGLGWLNGVLLSFGAALFIASLYFLPDDLYLSPAMMPVALLLLASTVAYVGGRADNRSFWQFNHGFWFSLAVAFLGALLIAGLISLLITAYGLLFDVTIKARVYQYALIVALFLIGLVFWLSLLPGSFDEPVKEGEPEEFTSKITALFVKYVFVPFFFLFALLFHGFALKVLVDGRLPAGQIGVYGVVLVGAGIATYLMAFPTAKTGGGLVRFFSRNWMWFLIVPLLLMILAYVMRLSQYGLTPSRYFLAGFILWAILMTAYAVFMKWRGLAFDLRVIPFFAAVILGLASVGPWGAEATSNSWQLSRLVKTLQNADVLDKGKIGKRIAGGVAERDQRRQINEALSFFSHHLRGERLAFLLDDKAHGEVSIERGDGKLFRGRKNRMLIAVREELGLTSPNIRARREGRAFTYRVREPFGFALPGKGSLAGPFYHNFSNNPLDGAKAPADKVGDAVSQTSLEVTRVQGPGQVVRQGDGEQAMMFGVEGADFIAYRDGVAIARFPLKDFAALAGEDQKNQKTRQMVIREIVSTKGQGAASPRLIVTTLSYRVEKNGGPVNGLTGVGFWLFIAD